jgi:hypothetical protein
MTALRGIVVALAGMLAVFVPGSVISVLARRGVRSRNPLLLWGMLTFLVALLVATFLATLIRLIVEGGALSGAPPSYLSITISAAINGIVIEGAMYVLLRWRKASVDGDGVIAGAGMGLLVGIFQGLAIIGAGMRLIFGDTSTEELAFIAVRPWPDLVAHLLAFILYRMAIITLSAALGMVVARALFAGQRRWPKLLAAMAIYAAFAWGYAALGLQLGTEALLPAVVAIVYEIVVIAAAYLWLSKNMQGALEDGGKSHRKRR